MPRPKGSKNKEKRTPNPQSLSSNRKHIRENEKIAMYNWMCKKSNFAIIRKVTSYLDSTKAEGPVQAGAILKKIDG